MKFNANGTIAAGSVQKTTRIECGSKNYIQSANLQLASRKVRLNQIAVLPDGSQWLKRRGGWTRVQ